MLNAQYRPWITSLNLLTVHKTIPNSINSQKFVDYLAVRPRVLLKLYLRTTVITVAIQIILAAVAVYRAKTIQRPTIIMLFCSL